MTTGKALLGVLAAAVAGAVIGVLFAPEKGMKTRKNMIRQGEDLANSVNDKLEEKFNEMISAVSGTMKRTRGQNEMVKTPSPERVS